MTVLRLALSALLPGTWTQAATEYRGTDVVGPADIYGNPAGDPTSQTQADVHAGAITLPYAAADGVSEQQVLTGIAFVGTTLQASAGLVTIDSYANDYGLQTGDYPGYWQTITADGPWNLIKDIAVTSLSSEALTVSNFVDVDVDTGSDMAQHVIDVEAAKRGTIVAAGSAETVTINYLSNEYSWSNTFDVTLGDGTNHLEIAPLNAYAASQITPLTPMAFNTAPQRTLLELQTGNGDNTISTQACSASIHLGRGSNVVTMLDGHNEVWTGGGSDQISIMSHAAGATSGVATDIGTDTVHLGSGATTVFLDDTNAPTMPHTTVVLAAGSGGTPTAAIWYGHGAEGFLTRPFAGGDWSHLTVDLEGFGAGSRVSLVQHAGDGYSALSVQNAQTGVVQTLDLVGGAPALGALHLVWT